MNHKIKNASCIEYNRIKFKSRLECSVYKWLIENGITPQYEPYTFTIWSGFKPNVPFYTKSKHNDLKLDNKKIIDIKYTPDFFFIYNGIRVFIEVKGIENDVFYIKKKLFRAYLEKCKKEKGLNLLYFEIFTKRQLLQAIEIIKNYEFKD